MRHVNVPRDVLTLSTCGPGVSSKTLYGPCCQAPLHQHRGPRSGQKGLTTRHSRAIGDLPARAEAIPDAAVALPRVGERHGKRWLYEAQVTSVATVVASHLSRAVVVPALASPSDVHSATIGALKGGVGRQITLLPSAIAGSRARGLTGNLPNAASEVHPGTAEPGRLDLGLPPVLGFGRFDGMSLRGVHLFRQLL